MIPVTLEFVVNPLVGAAAGFVYGKLCTDRPVLFAQIIAIGSIANSILYVLLSLNFEEGDPERYLNYAGTTMITHTATIIALKYFKLVPTAGIVVLGSIAAIYTYNMFHISMLAIGFANSGNPRYVPKSKFWYIAGLLM